MSRIRKIFDLREMKDAYIFNIPLILLAVIFIIIPVVGTLSSSLFRDVTFLPSKFIRLENYSRLFADKHFWQSFGFTFMFVLASVTIELILGMIFALVLNEKLYGRGFYRTALLIPWAIPIAISSRLWQLIYNYDYGVLNFIILKFGISSAPVNWLGTPPGAFISILIADVWKTTPFITIILLAGLSAIPNELYQQARIDGANFVRRFFSITLPILRPVLIVAVLFRTIDAVRIFDIVYVLTGGGPGGSTTPLSLYAYRYYLTGDFGYGSAVSVLVFISVSLLAILYIKAGKFKEVLK
jgi:trehalose/maltose transport system permease protein